MSDAPWLTDPKYGGMSETAARRSHEAWVAQGMRTLLPTGPALPESDAAIALRKRNIETQLTEYETAIGEAVAWFNGWKARRPKGFRAVRRRKPEPDAVPF